MKYLKVWTNFRELTATLEYDEVGRLFEMMLLYAETGEEPTEFTGNERFLWPVAKQQIDMASERNEKLRENGLKGGRPKSKDNQTKPNETKENQTKAEKKRKEIERNIKEIKIPSVSFIEDDAAQSIQREQDMILTASENAGFNTSPMSRSKLVELYATHGKDKMLNAIDECVRHGVTNIAYLEAVLRGGPRKAKPRVAAQDFEQRDYTDVQKELEDETARHVIEMLKAEGEWDYEHN